ncbi:rho guanine nucleotide exchange factor 3 isoform X3 [Scophthalmus maximus]|uniref:rho guanine nucleotide exchange factor 3 isoform X3 n=1 Tax=Scophthalmus maximus TaxID=52904 RepID=UPI001FA8F3F2|nr:rho guanine nucleotide exchange factor 3 isoform X3 [Scophthalmus maximus]
MQAGDGGQRGSRSKLQRKTSPSLFSPDGWSLRGKKRKQASRDADSLSLCSLDINEPSTKRSKTVSRVTSLANLLPPVKTAPLKRIGQTLQRSISFRNDGRTERAAAPPPPPPPPPPSSSSSSNYNSSLMTKTRVVSATVSNPSSSSSSTTAATRGSTATAPAAKRRDSKLWSETFDVRLGATQPLSPKEIKRQEAIFELAQGEQDLVEDLKLAKKAYHDPMLKLSIMTEQELNQIFGTLDSLIPLHEALLSCLRDARKPDGSTEHVGHILTDWLPRLSSYTPYCSNQVKAKALLDQKQQDGRVQDFLQRCRQSPFSRKLGLWNFLDSPRSRLVKYPLLLREILKHTPGGHPDQRHLEEAMLVVQSVVADINRRTGESECQYYKDRLSYAEDGQRDALIDRSRTLSCHGELKNNRGLKLHVFLFQDVLVITRSVSLSEQPATYQLCRQPIPIRQLDLEDVSDGEMRVGGSIRGAFGNNERTKNFFRVSSRSGGPLQSHCFQASDAFNKQQWINCIRQAKDAAALTGEPPQTGRCLETRLGGQMRPSLGGTAASSPGDSGNEDGHGTWGATGTWLGSEGKEGPRGGEEAAGGLSREGRETETGLAADGGTGLELDGETGMDGETRLTIGEAETGPTAADWRIDGGGGGETLSGGGNDDVPTFLLSLASLTQEREDVTEGVEQSVAKGEEEVGMEVGEELALRC